MKKIYSLLLLLIASSTVQSQNVLLVEHFNYPADSLLTSNNWFAHSGGTTNPVQVTNGGLSWNTTPYLGSGIGNAAAVNNTGQDVNRNFTAYVDSGDVYVSFLMKVNNEVTTVNDGYFFHIGEYDTPAAPVFTTISSAFRARTFIAPGTTPAQFKLGLTFNSATVPSTPGVDVSADLDTAQTYLVVLKYSFITGADNDSVSMYVFADGANIANEPATPTVGPLAGTASDLNFVQLVALRQYSSGQNVTVDGIIAQDNWNLLPQSISGPSLISPANNTFLNVNGPATTSAVINWTAAQNATGPVSYTWELAARAAGNINTPLASIPANNGGSDTSLTLSFGQIDGLLASLSVAVGDTVAGSWRVRAIAGTDTAYSNVFDIDIRRGTVTVNISNFNLLGPPNNTILPISGAGSQTATINWSAATAGAASVTYEWLAIAPGGSFTMPVVALPAAGDTSLTLTFTAIDALLASLNFNVGDSVFLDWTVRATAGSLTQLANQTWRITLFRGGLGTTVNDTLSAFALLSPPNNTALTIQGDPTQMANISWEASTASLNAAASTYTWMLDVPAGDFSNPVLSISAGSDTSLSLPFGAIADSLTAKGVAVGATFTGKWTVRASADTLARSANASFDISITRGVMSSVQDNAFGLGTQLYPNPAADRISIKFPASENGPVRLSLLNAMGQEIEQFRFEEQQADQISIHLGAYPNGTYLLKIQANDKLAVKRLVIQR